MSVVKDILRDLREKRLWPVAVVLVIALVAVPVVLSKSPSSKTEAALPQSPATAPADTALPAVNESSTQAHSKLNGHGRDPFGSGVGANTSGTSSTALSGSNTASANGSSSAGSSTTLSGGTGTGPTAGGGSTGGSTTPPSSGGASPGTGTTPGTPPNTIPVPPHKPAPTGLAANETYQVTFAMTNPSGGLDTIDSLTRLSALPSDGQPLMVELGVLQGGHRVLFLLQRGTQVSGPGTCTPGPIDCEILSMAPGQIERLGTASSTGSDSVGLFAVTGISARRYDSNASAARARRAVSAFGLHLISRSTSGALPLFRYEPGLGALVDLRNLRVGGN
jgi:hypothetical protein